MYLKNPFYAALMSADEPFSVSHGLARRFSPGVIPFAGVPEPSAEAFADLLALLEPGEKIYTTTDPGADVALAEGLELVKRFPGLQMRFGGRAPVDEDDPMVESLGREKTEEMLELKARAFPGYFGPRAPELGSFFGIRDAVTGRLVAMAGERLATFAEREVSAVCTDPEFLGRGYGARTVRAVLRHQARLGTGSILHVAAENKRAISLYERLGFHATGAIDFLKLRRN